MFSSYVPQTILILCCVFLPGCNSGSDNTSSGQLPVGSGETTSGGEQVSTPQLDLTQIPSSTVVTAKIFLRASLSNESGLTAINSELITWSLSPPGLAELSGQSELLAISPGIVNITASYGELQVSREIVISSFEERVVPTELSSRMPDYVREMNVLMLSFLPTDDGLRLDKTLAPNFGYLAERTIEDTLSDIENFSIAGKYMLEEGSRFRGYKDETARPYLGYQVLRHLVVYEQIPVDITRRIGSPFEINGAQYYAHQPDYADVFDRFSLTEYIASQSIDEVWIWYGEHAQPNWPSYDSTLHDSIIEHVGFVESNMSSLTTDDISNSYRYENDLPFVPHTYVVYSHNIWRGQNEMVHNHGHQLESIYKYVTNRNDGNEDLFVVNFSGWGPGYSTPPLGRAGDTHHPPNTTVDYDYTNPALVESDIEDWNPDGSGLTKPVNNAYWSSLPYNFPEFMADQDLSEPAWYIYWMQNMPGFENEIPWDNTGALMTNWWEFTADWDAAISQRLGLHR